MIDDDDGNIDDDNDNMMMMLTIITTKQQEQQQNDKDKNFFSRASFHVKRAHLRWQLQIPRYKLHACKTPKPAHVSRQPCSNIQSRCEEGNTYLRWLLRKFGPKTQQVFFFFFFFFFGGCLMTQWQSYGVSGMDLLWPLLVQSHFFFFFSFFFFFCHDRLVGLVVKASA